MLDYALIHDWLAFALRWLHVITAIAWIGSSFYFIALDLGLRKRPDLPDGVQGEEWQVHGGGFYHIQKYLKAPASLPEHLIWFKWESYATWLSGFALLAVVYYMGADLYLIDARKLDVSAPVAILLSIASLFIGWIAYDRVCKSKFGDDNTRLMLFLFVVLVVLSWGFDQIFSDRAALLHLGALTATIMSGNVFRVIIPNQTIVVEDLKAGRVPDAKYGKIAKQRSTHNNYLTLPVLFFMLSNHYPLAFASEYNWIIAALVFLMGVTIRHFFNTMHAGGGKLWWTWGVTTGLFVAIMALSMAPLNPPNERDNLGALPPAQQRFVEAEGFDEAYLVVVSRCSMCHGEYPAWDNLRVAPKGVVLETEGQIAAHAHEIFLQAGVTHAMPPSNITEMEPEERDAIVAWYRAAQ